MNLLLVLTLSILATIEAADPKEDDLSARMSTDIHNHKILEVGGLKSLTLTVLNEYASHDSKINCDFNWAAENEVVMYSKTYCPYCKKTKNMLSRYPIADLKVIELDRLKDMKAMQSILRHKTGRATVPQLFIGGEFVGGHDETRGLEDRGELRKMFEKARAL
ncbi:Glutaredoxin [Oesophagostomum dentatum]|uniref:Glutaredoxin n=1 Tax=Oesophagostomum dentatum TaxID=61180 RepID=A0A0B1TR29_OESDE|nr:Glutaredoxin [Oesophagostomum dentatum]